ncbi:uncharacterized protein LOC106181434 [Lingula anatina]|uniref:Uncharacterized protein LOC106181434 n=1 Tax=Lingula anatina TaxID=7574 RepID=A0A1S3KFJ8_LINAN|nr:uncharacterized protein LOC106181434 [Lingula anatina]|eukprot:XP_013421262.1 uncharacterized protein LOC106181434 [Lingula anatina]
MEQLTGIKPHLIISNLHRVKMDPNRSVNEAAFGVPNAMQAYREYHSFIREAYGRVRGAGLFIDIHGQSHPNRWIELGYLVSTRRLNENNAIPQFSSIRSLYNSLRDYVTFDHLLRGDYSLGRLLNRRGYRAVPSPGIRAPGRAAYFTGGYSTMTYGSRFSGKIDSIQVESPVHLRTDRRRPTYARDLAKVLRDFMALYN